MGVCSHQPPGQPFSLGLEMGTAKQSFFSRRPGHHDPLAGGGPGLPHGPSPRGLRGGGRHARVHHRAELLLGLGPGGGGTCGTARAAGRLVSRRPPRKCFSTSAPRAKVANTKFRHPTILLSHACSCNLSSRAVCLLFIVKAPGVTHRAQLKIGTVLTEGGSHRFGAGHIPTCSMFC